MTCVYTRYRGMLIRYILNFLPTIRFCGGMLTIRHHIGQCAFGDPTVVTYHITYRSTLCRRFTLRYIKFLGGVVVVGQQTI